MKVPGHSLLHEGAAFDDNGDLAYSMFVNTAGAGRAKCSCGEMSDVLKSGGERRRWHTDHKAALAAGIDAATKAVDEALNRLGPPPGWKP